MNRLFALIAGFAMLLGISCPAGTLADESLGLGATSSDAETTSRVFDFGTSEAPAGVTAVTPDDEYDDAKGFGFESSEASSLVVVAHPGHSDCITSSKPFNFSVKLPEGSYRVSLTIGAADRATKTTVKAELRRLMLHGIESQPGEFRTETFLVNIRTPRIDNARSVRLKPRERQQEWRAWDDRLTLEFNDRQPAIASLTIEPVDNLPVLYLMGDSTVCDQPSEDYNSWGQMLTAFFQPTIVLSNHGESGESYRGALSAGRFEKIFCTMKPGDFLMVQFGHNDMKSVDEANFAESIRKVVADCRRHGGTPIIVSSMERRGFDAEGHVRESLRGFPATAQATANDLDVAFVDLHAMSKILYAAWGPEKAPLAFARNGADPTHHNSYGSYQLAKCVVQGLRHAVPNLAQHLSDGLPDFDPEAPDDQTTFSVPASPSFATLEPEGN